MSYLSNSKYTLIDSNITFKENTIVQFKIQQIGSIDFKIKDIDIDLFTNDDIYNKTVVELFDTLHDFGKYGICYDIVNYNRTLNKSYLDRLAFYYLDRFSFNLDNKTIPAYFSNLSWSSGTYPSKLSIKELENYFTLNAISKKINKGSNNVYYLHNCLSKNKDLATKKLISKNIIEAFNEKNWLENGKLNIIIDTSKSMGDYIEVNDEKSYAYVLTQESINDPSCKLSPFDETKIKSKYGVDSYFYESPNDNDIRIYRGINNTNKKNYDTEFVGKKIIYHDIEGIYDVILKGFQKDDTTKHIFSNVEFNYENIKDELRCKLNSQKKHDNCITQVKNKIRSLEQNITELNNPEILLDRNNFYSQLGSLININDNNKKYIQYFSQKRCGDALQAKIATIINSGKTILKCKKINGENQNITKLILITIDRMLFTYALLNDIPAILDGGDYMLFNIPNYSTMYQIPETVFNVKPENLEVVNIVPVNIQETIKQKKIKNITENANKLLAEVATRKSKRITEKQGGLRDDIDVIVNENLKEPIVLYNYLPFIINQKGGKNRNKYKTIYDNINKHLDNFPTYSLITNNINEYPMVCLYDSEFEFNNDNYIIDDIGDFNIIHIDLPNNELYVYNDRENREIYFSFNDKTLEPIKYAEFNGIISAHFDIRGGGYKKIFGGSSDRLGNYIEFYNNDDITTFNGKQIMQIYLELFEYYEMSICIDDEQNEIDFSNITNNIQLADNKSIYIFFDKIKFLVDKANANLYFNNIEYFLYNSKYGREIYNSLLNIKQYVYADEYDYDLSNEPVFKGEITIEKIQELQNIIDIQIDISLKEQIFVINDLQKNPNNYERYKLFTRYGFSNMLFDFNEKINKVNTSINKVELPISSEMPNNVFMNKEELKNVMVPIKVGGKKTRRHNKKISRNYRIRKNKSKRRRNKTRKS
jgi:hypothetical protein